MSNLESRRGMLGLRVGCDAVALNVATSANDEEYVCKRDAAFARVGDVMRPLVLEKSIDGVVSNAILNYVYRIVLSNCWQPFPRLMLFNFDGLYSYGERLLLSNRVRLICNITLSNYFHLNTCGELEELMNNFPSNDVSSVPEQDRKVYLSNCSRERAILLLTLKCDPAVNTIDVVGWNDYEAQRALLSGFNLNVYDLGLVSRLSPFVNVSSDLNVTKKSLPFVKSFRPPTIEKTKFALALFSSYVVKNAIIYDLNEMDLLLLMRRLPLRCNGMGGDAIIGFRRSNGGSYESKVRTHLKRLGFKLTRMSIDYADNDCESFRLFCSQKGHLSIFDDAHHGHSSMRYSSRLAISRLNFYYSVIRWRRSQGVGGTTIICPFTWKEDFGETFSFSFFQDVIMQPGVFDSNEVRIVLTDSGSNFLMYRVGYIVSVEKWRGLSLRDQYEMSSCYFKHITKQEDYLIASKKSFPLLCSFALTSTIYDKMTGMRNWSKTFNLLKEKQLPCIVLLARNVIVEAASPQGLVVTRHKERTYMDWSVNYQEIDKLGLVLINFLGVVGAEGPGYMDMDYHYLRALRGTFSLDQCPIVCIGGSLINEYSVQSVQSSPGPFIKCFTTFFKVEHLLSPQYTYIMRLNLVIDFTNLNSLKVTVFGHSDLTFRSHTDQQLSIIKGPLKGWTLNLIADEDVVVSGHMLNLLIAAQHGFNYVFTWINQWKTQSSLKGRSGSDVILSLAKKYYDDIMLFDYNPDGSKGMLDPWHSYADVLLALVCAQEYLIAFGVAPPLDDEIKYYAKKIRL